MHNIRPTLHQQTAAQRKAILHTLRLPARLVSEEAAAVLGFEAAHVPILVREGLLKPLGKPKQNSIKHFAAVHIAECGEDPKWLHEATKAVSDYHFTKNQKARQVVGGDQPENN